MHVDEMILILAKTYPSPSAKYNETSCVAGINEAGQMRRLFPVPFRLLEDESQFKKWQWIRAKIRKAANDHRPESHNIAIDTIEIQERLGTSHGWRDRWQWIEKIPSFDSLAQLEAARETRQVTLALMRPRKLLALEITPENSNWTREEEAKLLKGLEQGDLFSQAGAAEKVAILRKVPFSFYVRYETPDLNGRSIELRHKIVDWEAGALYWNCQKHGLEWERFFRQKLEGELFIKKDLMLMLGTIHRFPGQWLVISLIYPPKQPPRQPSLFDIL